MREVTLTDELLHNSPKSINADLMTDEELEAKLIDGYDDIKKDKVYLASEAFEKFLRKHS